jgi:hypothetical protein
MEDSTFSLIRFYLFILAGFFIWMYMNKKNWYQHRLIYQASTVFVPVFMFVFLLLIQTSGGKVELPAIEIPQVQMPAFQMPSMQMPSFQMPTMQMPRM